MKHFHSFIPQIFVEDIKVLVIYVTMNKVSALLELNKK